MSYYNAFQGLKNMGEKDSAKGKQISYGYLPLKKNETDVRAES